MVGENSPDIDTGSARPPPVQLPHRQPARAMDQASAHETGARASTTVPQTTVCETVWRVERALIDGG